MCEESLIIYIPQELVLKVEIIRSKLLFIFNSSDSIKVNTKTGDGLYTRNKTLKRAERSMNKFYSEMLHS